VLIARDTSTISPPGGAAGFASVQSRVRADDVATITVSRTSADDAGMREVFVSVDREPIAILRHGEAVTHELPAGPHRLRAHNTLFWRTHDVSLHPGGAVRVVNKAGGGFRF
jgi:hypothetical protein